MAVATGNIQCACTFEANMKLYMHMYMPPSLYAWSKINAAIARQEIKQTNSNYRFARCNGTEGKVQSVITAGAADGAIKASDCLSIAMKLHLNTKKLCNGQKIVHIRHFRIVGECVCVCVCLTGNCLGWAFVMVTRCTRTCSRTPERRWCTRCVRVKYSMHRALNN